MRMHTVHSGFYGGAGRKSLHAVFLPKGKVDSTNQLIYFKDFIMEGIFEKLTEQDKLWNPDAGNDQYLYLGCQEVDKPMEVTSREVFKDWRMVWDERFTSRSPQEPHLPADCIKDTFGKLDRDDNNKRTRVGGTFEGPILRKESTQGY